MRTRAILAVALAAALLSACSSGEVGGGSAADSSITDEMLLVSTEMPAWNNAGTWVATDDADVLRACALPDADSLGATITLARTFTYVVALAEGESGDPQAPPMLGLSAVSSYPDDAAAAAAVDAYVAALDECEATMLSELDGGSTWTVFARDDSSDGGWFDFVGVTAHGSSTTMVGFSLNGQDANYEGDPLAASMQAAVARLP